MHTDSSSSIDICLLWPSVVVMPIIGPRLMDICKMTIKGISDFLKNRGVPHDGRSSDKDPNEPMLLSSLAPLSVAIEMSGIVYQQNIGAVKAAVNGYPYVYSDTNGWSYPSTDEVLEMFGRFLKARVNRIVATGIKPVFVLEGLVPDAKDATAERRRNDKGMMSSKPDIHRHRTDVRMLKNSLYGAYPPGPRHHSMAKSILDDLGIDYVMAKYEAEGVCAALVKEGRCQAALIDDYDIFMYGCPIVARNMMTTRNKDIEIMGIAMKDILTTIGFLADGGDQEKASERFSLLCMMCGTDYAENIPQMGPARIHDLFIKHNIHTYDELCLVDSRFCDMPYESIKDTLRKNAEYR